MDGSKLKSHDMDALFEAALSLKSTEECYMFFEDVCTVTELTAMAQRFRVANMLSEKKTCQTIAGETGASTATISRVNRCLQYGAGGYGLVIGRLGEKK